MRVLGIDPGLNTTGYGIIEENDETISVQEAGVVRTDSKEAFEKRLLDIGKDIQAVIEQFKPDVIAVEELYSHYKHPRTAIIMGHARGIIFLKAAEANVKVFPYSATKVKSSLTGNGRASKSQVQQMICSSLNMSGVPEPPDVADALAVALCHLRAIRQRQAIEI